MKLSNILLGLVVICISIAFIQDDFINLKIKNNGKIVSMEIIDKPRSCLGTKANWFMKVKYHNKILTKKIPGTFCEEHAVGDIIDVRYLEGEDRILLPDEGVRLGFIGSGFFIIVGLYVLYHGLVNKSNRVKKR